jgi:hypothetical protein
MGGVCNRNKEMRNAYKIFVGVPECKRSSGRPGRRWRDKIRMDLKEIRWEVVSWIYLFQDSHQR